MSKSKKNKASYQKLRQKRKQGKALKRKRKEAVKHKHAISHFLSLLSGISLSRKELTTCNQYPIFECQISDNWEESGLAYIWLSRKTQLHIVTATFLVDIKCLGLKDTYLTAFSSQQEYKGHKMITTQAFHGSFTLKNCSPSLVHSIIYGGILYARKFGFEPHKDFQQTKYLLNQNMEKREKVEFGEGGKPLYISGPNDNVETILQKLTASVGKDGFRFINNNPDNR